MFTWQFLSVKKVEQLVADALMRFSSLKEDKRDNYYKCEYKELVIIPTNEILKRLSKRHFFLNHRVVK